MKLSIIAFDVADNALGRADLLARLASVCCEVEVVGPSFGRALWPPVAHGPVRYRPVPLPRRYPSLAWHAGELLAAVDGDVVYASKLRPTSYGAGLLARRARRRPLLLDIDDWELGFFKRSPGVWSRIGRLANLTNPNGMAWTWLMEPLARAADGTTVATRFLQARFGGTLLPHVRDTDAWRPGTHDGEPVRRALGIGDRKTVMFLGTPRAYKGVEDLIDAVGRLRGAVAVVVGATHTGPREAGWRALDHVRLVGGIPFDQVPRYLAAADVVAVPQRATPDTVGQLPAKLLDAMALGRPIVTTDVGMIAEVVGDGALVVPPGSVDALAAAIGHLLADADLAGELGRRARQRCEERYSFTAGRSQLLPLLERVRDVRTARRRRQAPS